MANAAGIHTRRTDRLTFAIGCGIAGVAGAAFTTIGSTGPTSGSLYIVDSFLVVTFGGAASLAGTVASAFGIAQTQSITEFFLTGSMARVLTLLLIVTILMIRPQGLFAPRCGANRSCRCLPRNPSPRRAGRAARRMARLRRAGWCCWWCCRWRATCSA